jgi:Fe2+ transport system protein FeoA
MFDVYIACPMCGFRINTEESKSCQACPLNKDCSLVCCPNCGHMTVDPQQSFVARRISKMLTKLRVKNTKVSGNELFLSLLDVPRGNEANVICFADEFPIEKREHLMAYGVYPGVRVRVMQHKPVTILQVNHLEIALDDNLAHMIHVRV